MSFRRNSSAFVQVTPVFHSPVYPGFVTAFVLWPLANVWLILRLPALNPARAIVHMNLPVSHAG